MFPNLLSATNDYWRKLDELELAYQKGELSIEEVDAEVKILMQELGEQRRMAFSFFQQQCQRWLIQNKETVIGVVTLLIIAYLWHYQL